MVSCSKIMFKSSGNVLVIFEEKCGDPTKISFLRRKVSGACALVAEDHPSLGLDPEGEDKLENYQSTPFARLACPKDSHISAIKFTSFGTPSGTCGSYQIGGFHDPNSSLLVEKACLNKKELEAVCS
ncbi:hypothetical protein K1719_014576 [Acacia pycnantha]|nr:hypothetical protein K1719_014576 [Acacia pycnantha]